jgi:hypothetical protein
MHNVPTYQMNFKAKLQRIDVKSQTMIVDYTDPHGNENIVMNLPIRLPFTEDNIKKIIVEHTPHQSFHFNNLNKIAVEAGELDRLVDLANTEFEYKIPTYDN